jgi:hypothetical protein
MFLLALPSVFQITIMDVFLSGPRLVEIHLTADPPAAAFLDPSVI